MSAPAPTQTCANCGAPLDGPYCAKCGQSDEELARPFYALALDWLDGAFTWDGRLSTTVRALFLRPGEVARAYMDGKRATYTPPVRLYLLASLIFFGVMSVLDVRVVALETGLTNSETIVDAVGEDTTAEVDRESRPAADAEPAEEAPPDAEDGDDYAAFLTLSAFRRGPLERPAISDEVIERTRLLLESQDAPSFVVTALSDPDLVERRINAAASQAVIAVVLAFALLNLLLHPRRPLIGHIVHSLYFHAALMPLVAAWVATSTAIPLPTGLAIALAIVGFVLFWGLILAFDRGFYGSSWIGLALRAPALLLGYLTAFAATSLCLAFLALPR